MAEELGQIQRPSASQYDGRRKLLLVPLIYGPQADDEEGATVLQNYWEQMQTQVTALEGALGGLQHIYHESLTVGGSEGMEQLGNVDLRSHGFIIEKTQNGAVLEATEDMDVLLDLGLTTVHDDPLSQRQRRIPAPRMALGQQQTALRTHSVQH